jgi:hypothetical protein
VEVVKGRWGWGEGDTSPHPPLAEVRASNPSKRLSVENFFNIRIAEVKVESDHFL